MQENCEKERENNFTSSRNFRRLFFPIVVVVADMSVDCIGVCELANMLYYAMLTRCAVPCQRKWKLCGGASG